MLIFEGIWLLGSGCSCAGENLFKLSWGIIRFRWEPTTR